MKYDKNKKVDAKYDKNKKVDAAGDKISSMKNRGKYCKLEI